MTKHNEIQMDKKLRSAKLRTENNKQNVFDSESRSDLSFTVQKDTEVIHRESQRKNDDQLSLEGEPVRILGNTSPEGFGKETLGTQCKKGSHDYTLCDIEDTSKDGYTQTKLTPE